MNRHKVMRGRRIRVRGQVQGVGFRPFVWRLARRLGVSGDVHNDGEGVLIHALGGDLDAFEAALTRTPPPLARVETVRSAHHDFTAQPRGFTILASHKTGAETRVTPDAATCPDCASEIRDPAGRRFGYAFTSCTHCGPRYSILTGLPYDRARTTMAPFALCAACAAEYSDPADRRFHAQPIACPACGPRLWLEADGREQPGDPLAQAAALLTRGRILAIKGLGGFHLACDARDETAVARLRRRKRRPGKPFALMGTLEMARAHAEVSEAEAALLGDPAAPIVLLARADALAASVAPGQSTLGWMLPYTPMHHLLLDRFGGPLVMTSGNPAGAPQAIGDDEAREGLCDIADAFVMHDRAIARRLDDGVERIMPRGRMVLRRARGRAPGTLPLPPGFGDVPQVVAYGGQLKSSICLIRNGEALLSQHLGDLDDARNWQAFGKAEADCRALFDHRPALAACDLHPGYRASRHAAATGLPLVEVQHHHAHLAACLGENLWPRDGGPVAGIVLDGLGLGTDGTIWGGEVLLGDYAGVERRHWLKPAPLPGGDKAQTEPWRNALMRLDAAGLSDWADALFPDAPHDLVRQAAAAGINAPLSSSAGRLFDAVAACLGLCSGGQSYEGEAAMLLEALAESTDSPGFDFGRDGAELDPSPMFRALWSEVTSGKPASWCSAHFHAGLARSFALAAKSLVESGEARAVALSGGCFQNALLLEQTIRWLGDVPVLIHTRIPANDGGLALGQALVAAAEPPIHEGFN